MNATPSAHLPPRIVITGGPGAGKTTALNAVRTFFSKKGFRVLVIPETATELIEGGLAPWNCASVFDFQKTLFALQRSKEDSFFECPLLHPDQKCLILLDRGLLDGKAYLPFEEFARILDQEQISEEQICSRYDAVFYLESAASLDSALYTVENNRARSESAQQAVKVDQCTRQVWKDHPRLEVIEACPDFEQKLQILLCRMSQFLEPKPDESPAASLPVKDPKVRMPSDPDDQE